VTYGVLEGGEPLIDDVEIIGGLSHYKEYAVKTNGTVTNCLFDGVYMAVLMGHGTITKNTFLNTRHGTVIDINNGLVKDNVIDGGKRAIKVGNASIISNTIMNMENVGINVQRDRTPYTHGKLKPRIAANTIVACGEAIKIWGDAKPVITNNLILENSHGISLADNAFYGGAKPRIENNAFYNNEYNVYMYREDPRIEVLVSNNWWGTNDTNIIEEKIYDKEDDPRLCKVLFDPFQSQPPHALPKVSYRISVSTPRKVIEITDKVVVSGSVAPPLETISMIITCLGPDGERTDAAVSTSRDGGFSYEFTPGSVGLWRVSLSPQENVLFDNSLSDLQVNVTKMSSRISLGVTPQACFEGAEVTFAGVLAPAIQGQVIEFDVLCPDGSVSTGHSMTDSLGAFTHTLNGGTPGNYRATVSWRGTQHYKGSTETLSYRIYKSSKITIYVEAEDGTHVEKAEIMSTAQPAGQGELIGTSDASGAAVFSYLVYGDYTFSVEKEGYEPATLSATLTEGEASVVRCVLTEKVATPPTPDTGAGDGTGSSKDPWYLGFVPSMLTFVILVAMYGALHRLRTR
jgi:hypothetical protein